MENGETLINCLAYIDLNPVRAGLVSKPEDYRWNAIGYNVQTNNKDGFCLWTLDFENSAQWGTRIASEGIDDFSMK